MIFMLESLQRHDLYAYRKSNDPPIREIVVSIAPEDLNAYIYPDVLQRMNDQIPNSYSYTGTHEYLVKYGLVYIYISIRLYLQRDTIAYLSISQMNTHPSAIRHLADISASKCLEWV